MSNNFEDASMAFTAAHEVPENEKAYFYNGLAFLANGLGDVLSKLERIEELMEEK